MERDFPFLTIEGDLSSCFFQIIGIGKTVLNNKGKFGPLSNSVTIRILDDL